MNRKRSQNTKTRMIQQTLEKHGRFDYEYMPKPDKWTMPDARYRYRQRGLNRFATGVWRTLLATFGPPAIRLLFGAKVVGRENLKALKKSGAICVCNHFNYLDTLFVRAAVGHYRSFHTMAAYNNRRGIGGHIIRHGGMLPFSADRVAMKNLLTEMDRLFKKGKIVNFYAEQAMWKNYQKPRPMKDGAFHYAVKFGVPVLPVFCTFRRTKRGYIRKLRIHILPAVYPDKELARPDRIAAMKSAAQAEWKECYERAYGIPLVYGE